MQDVEKKTLQSLTKSSRALLNTKDYHQRAKEKLPQMVYDFYSTAPDDQLTLNDNQQAFRRIKLRPKILVDVSTHSIENSLNCQIQLLNSTATISFSCIIAPTALHRLANDEYGELTTVRAAVACSTIMCVSTAASRRMELITEEYRQQITDRLYSQKLIVHAKKCGYKALVLTVDHCELGNRECDVRNNFTLPNGIQAENLIDTDDIDDFSKTYRRSFIDAALSWKDLDWIRSIASLPLIIKGVIHPDDARTAVRYGVQDIVVSSHGGRQLDTCQSIIQALPDIVRAVNEEKYPIDIYLDVGIRRGTDILKAIALGAKAVLIGRPILWGLAVDGEQGVQNVLQMLKK